MHKCLTYALQESGSAEAASRGSAESARTEDGDDADDIEDDDAVDDEEEDHDHDVVVAAADAAWAPAQPACDRPALAELAQAGAGSFGSVTHVQLPDGRRAVLKTMEARDAASEAETTDAWALAAMDSPFVPALLGHWRDATHKYALMESCGTDLHSMLAAGRLGTDDATVRLLAWSVASALDCAHAAGLAHNDLKPANVCVRQTGADPAPRATLVDWGCASPLGLDEAWRGTDGYRAPENAHSGRACSKANDVWALGRTLADVLLGLRWSNAAPNDPHALLRDPALVELLARGHRGDLLARLLDERPAHRLGADGSVAAALLEHPFFRDLPDGDRAEEEALRAWAAAPRRR